MTEYSELKSIIWKTVGFSWMIMIHLTLIYFAGIAYYFSTDFILNNAVKFSIPIAVFTAGMFVYAYFSIKYKYNKYIEHNEKMTRIIR